MKELSLFDKFKVLFDNILEHPLFIVLFFVPIVIFFLQKKHGKKVYIIVYFLVILSILFLGGDVIFKLFDNLMNGIFMVLYFPNFITLFIVVVLSSLIALISLFNKKMKKVNKIINFVSFGIVQMIFALILITVRVKEINIYKDNALYTNNDVLTLMQLLIGTFALQIISILIINLINKVTYILDKKEGKIIDDEIEKLSLSKKSFKTIPIDNNKVGYINVANKNETSKPQLKPFKFNIEKIESIRLENDYSKPKLIKQIDIKDKDFTYLNEVIINKKFKPLRLRSSKMTNIVLNNKLKDKKFINKLLASKPVTYLNEIIVDKKLKPIKLDSKKIESIKLNGKLKDKKILTKDLQEKPVTYLNEVINEKKIKPLELDLNKTQNIKVDTFDLKKKPDLLKNQEMYNYNIEKSKLDSSSKFDEIFNSRPVLKPEVKEDINLVEKLSIIDIQSTLDVVIKYRLMKYVNLKMVNNLMAVDNLQIPNFDSLNLLSKKHKLYKQK